MEGTRRLRRQQRRCCVRLLLRDLLQLRWEDCAIGLIIHLCAPKTKFFPCGVDKVERCLECHEQAMREYGGRIQIAKVKKQFTSEKR